MKYEQENIAILSALEEKKSGIFRQEFLDMFQEDKTDFAVVYFAKRYPNLFSLMDVETVDDRYVSYLSGTFRFSTVERLFGIPMNQCMGLAESIIGYEWLEFRSLHSLFGLMERDLWRTLTLQEKSAIDFMLTACQPDAPYISKAIQGAIRRLNYVLQNTCSELVRKQRVV